MRVSKLRLERVSRGLQASVITDDNTNFDLLIRTRGPITASCYYVDYAPHLNGWGRKNIPTERLFRLRLIPLYMEVDTYGGAVVVRDSGHRWWFDVTEERNLVLCAEVVDMDKPSMTGAGRRHYPDNPSITDEVRDALLSELDDGEKILDRNGREL